MMLRILPLKIKLTIRELKLTRYVLSLTNDVPRLTNYVQLRAPVNHLQSKYRYLTLAL